MSLGSVANVSFTNNALTRDGRGCSEFPCLFYAELNLSLEAWNRGPSCCLVKVSACCGRFTCFRQRFAAAMLLLCFACACARSPIARSCCCYRSNARATSNHVSAEAVRLPHRENPGIRRVTLQSCTRKQKAMTLMTVDESVTKGKCRTSSLSCPWNQHPRSTLFLFVQNCAMKQLCPQLQNTAPEQRRYIAR